MKAPAHDGSRSGSRLLLLRVQYEGKRNLDGVGDPLRTLPVALAGTKVQTLELGSADELGRLAQGNQLKTDWDILRYPAQCQGAARRVSAAGLHYAARHVVGSRKVC